MPALSTSWRQDVLALSPGADPGAVRDIGADLLRRWSEPHRRYHTTAHLLEMFGGLEDLAATGVIDARDATIGRLAAWLHDAVYTVPDADGNEERSAELASDVLLRLGLRARDVATVERLVRASERHELPDSHGLDAAFHDADLWVLSAAPERFDAYCAQVREEYAQVPDAAYARGRTALLAPFLDRPRIYATDAAHAGWTERARVNLRRELDRLS